MNAEALAVPRKSDALVLPDRWSGGRYGAVARVVPATMAGLMKNDPPTSPADVRKIIDIDALIAGHARLTIEQALWLYHHASLHDLGEWATAMANRIHGDRVRTYVIDRNINYTNVCVTA